MTQEWTTRPPTEPGWYWCFSIIGDIEMLWLYVDSHDGSKTLWGNRDPVEFNDFTHWLGPLSVPEPPQ